MSPPGPDCIPVSCPDEVQPGSEPQKKGRTRRGAKNVTDRAAAPNIARGMISSIVPVRVIGSMAVARSAVESTLKLKRRASRTTEEHAIVLIRER